MEQVNNFFKNIFNKKYSHISIIIISIICSLFIEIIVGTSFFKTDNYKRTIENRNLIITSSKDKYVVETNKINKFIKELQLHIDYKAQKNIKYKIYLKSSNKKYKYIGEEKLNFAQYNKPIIKINKKIENLKIVFSDIKDTKIEIKSLTLNNRYQFNFIRFLSLIIVIYLFLDVFRLIYLKERPVFYKYCFKLFFLISLVFTVINPMYNSLDEKEHFVRSYNIAHLNFFQEDNELTKWPVEYGDIIDRPYDIYFPTTYSGFIENFKYLDKLGKSKKQYLIHNSTAEPYLFPTYIVSSFGIIFGNALNLTLPFQFYLGRLFNAIFCSLILAFAIKLSGKYKKIFFIVSMFPLVLFQNSSYSADCLTNAFCILSFSLTLYYRNEKKNIGIKEGIILILSYLMSFCSKIAYFPIGIIALLIPNKNFKSKFIAYFIKILSIISCIGLFIIGTLYANNIGIVQWHYPNVDSTMQIRYLIKKPYSFIISVFNTLNSELFSKFKSMISIGYNGDLGEIGLFILFILLIISIATTKSSKLLTKLDKLIILLFIILAIFSSMGALYISFTPVGLNKVLGYQGRYLVPMILATLLLFTSKKFRLDISDENAINIITSISVLLNIIAILIILNKFYF